jgi:hypothetical protein
MEGVDEHGPNDPGFGETLRSIAEELGRFIEDSAENVDLDEFAGSFGVEPDRVRSWVENAGSWFRAQAENLGQDLAHRMAGQPEPATSPFDPLGGVGPHPLDLPTAEQGLALAALDSGRWMVEPGTETLTARGEGPGPREALGLVRELRARDWISADGQLTLVGRHALSRWLDASDTQ